MIYIYLITAIFLALVASTTSNNALSNTLLRCPAILGCVTYGILAAKGFGLI